MKGGTLKLTMEQLRRKGTNDKGFILLSTMVLFILVSGTVYGMIAATGTTIKGSSLSRDFIQSGQMADYAVQDAIYQLNERPGTPHTGTIGNGAWSWEATCNTGGDCIDDGTAVTINAEGTFRSATRRVEATAGSLQVGGFEVQAPGSDNPGEITYEVSPATAFSHTILGRDVTVQNGIGQGAGSVFLSGTVGMLGSSLDVSNADGLEAETDVDYLLYGGAASTLNLSGSSRVPVGLELDSQFITDNMSRCGGADADEWVASHHGGILVANNNAGCYSSMTFDVPTTVVGTGAFNAFVSGGVTFGDNVSAPTGTGLNIYTGGNVDFKTEAASGSSLNLQNTFIYAPEGICRTHPFRSTTKPLDFTGSLACDTVTVAGEIQGADPVEPLGDDIYNSDIWYLINYQQPSGTRG